MAASDGASESKNTERVIKRSVALFREFLMEENFGNDQFEGFTKNHLSDMVKRFFASVSKRKKDGMELKRSTLLSIKYGLSKYLKDYCEVNINIDPVFTSALTTFKGKVLALKKKGKGAVDHRKGISVEDMVKLRNDSDALNTNTPCGLQKKVWFDTMYYLCGRGHDKLREMTKSTFRLAKDATGRRYIYQVVNKAHKKQRGALLSDETVGEGKMYEQPDDPKCPVASYLKYVGKLHPDVDCFWPRALDVFVEDSDVWYCRIPVGKNTLSKWMGDLAHIAGLSQHYTNHCIRVTSIAALDRAGVEARHIMRVTGHKCESSVRNVAVRSATNEHLTESQQRDISDMLANAIGSSARSVKRPAKSGNTNAKPIISDTRENAMETSSAIERPENSHNIDVKPRISDMRPNAIVETSSSVERSHNYDNTNVKPIISDTPANVMRPSSSVARSENSGNTNDNPIPSDGKMTKFETVIIKKENSGSANVSPIPSDGNMTKFETMIIKKENSGSANVSPIPSMAVFETLLIKKENSGNDNPNITVFEKIIIKKEV